jgi:ABC-type sugar transport system permease subunit
MIAAFQERQLGARLVPQLAFAIGYVAVYLWWSRAYYRVVDPWIRERIGRRLGVKIVWIFRKGNPSGEPLSFRPRYSAWSWGVQDDGGRTLLKDGLVYVLSIIVVSVVCGLWPAALFFAVFLGTHFLHGLVALPLVFITIPIYAIYWSGRYEQAGMRP